MAVTPSSSSPEKYAVAVVNDEPIRMIARRRLSELLQRPVRRRKEAEACRDDHQEIARHNGFGVVPDEGKTPLPGMGLRQGASLAVPRDRTGVKPGCRV